MTRWLVDSLAALLNKEVEFDPTHVPMTDFDRLREELRPADVLLVEGRTRISRIIQSITYSPWSHAALYLGRLDEISDGTLKNRVAEFYPGDHHQPLIVEALLGEGTVVAPLSKYKGEHLRICRPRGLSMTDRNEVIEYSLSHLGYQYDVRHLLDLARFLLPYSFIPRRWRSSLFTHNAGEYTKTVCSYMIGMAFTSVSFPILPVAERLGDGNFRLYKRNPKLFTPSDFDYSPYFDIIKYPYLNLDEVGAYRSLPWDEELICNAAGDCYPAPEPGTEREPDTTHAESNGTGADRNP